MAGLTVWAPNAFNVELVHGEDKSSFVPPINLVVTTQTYKGVALEGYWQLPPDINFPLQEGEGYWFKITLADFDTKYRIDPYSRALQHSASYSIYRDPNSFQWTDSNFVPPRFDALVIYQIFQGAYVGRGDHDWRDKNGDRYHFEWNNKRKGNFKQLKNKLDYIESLGVNAIELLPVNEYNGDDYLGYSSVSFFAIEASYGGVHGDGSSYNDLKEFINEAHARHIAVIADVVVNHIGQVGDSGPLWHYDSKIHNIYFNGEQAYDQAGGTFGEAPDWSKPQIQKYIEDACNYYLQELHFDGLRFDFTSQIVNKAAGQGANSGLEVLRAIVWRLKQAFPHKIIICEHWNEPGSDEAAQWMIDYVNFDAHWFNFRKRMQNVLWPFASGKENELATAINGGDYRVPHNRVIYANDHDECWWDGNGDPHKFYPVSEFNGGRGDYWSIKKSRMMYSLSFFIPGIPMFFMGDEFAMEGAFNDSRFENILDWSLEKTPLGSQFKRMFIRLIDIKKTFNPLMQSGNVFAWLHYPADGWFAFKRKWNADVLIVAGNYTGGDMYSYRIDTGGETGQWSQVFNSDGQEFGGDGVGNLGHNPYTYQGGITINIPRNGLVVMVRAAI